ncbi:hypothetical protein [Nitrospirillum sp. BR 11163]|uniref:hypothetical protein n=1 Tax=Nitrospirillum sp. BR 11163 TaxID=3104323 RepID=UPI002AFEEF04|nr:hypothetical protein [Nitrospirillum sp. BR 11163]MEA1677353.1 hypothetical protein [Nitrospirillum sp. BR 11163]
MFNPGARRAFRVVACSVAFAAAAWCPLAMAAGFASAGSISNILPTRGGTFFFLQHGTRTNRPACSTLDRWVINVTTPSGQAMASAVMLAYSLGKNIEIYGTGDCRDWPDTETVDYFQIAD